MHRVTIAAGETIYQQGQSWEYAFLVLSGEVAMERDGVRLGSGKDTVIGFSSLVGQPYGSTATATDTSSLLAFTRKELREVIRSDPDRALSIIDGIINLVHRMNAAAPQSAPIDTNSEIEG